jgi:hypothetical protein
VVLARNATTLNANRRYFLFISSSHSTQLCVVELHPRMADRQPQPSAPMKLEVAIVSFILIIFVGNASDEPVPDASENT